MPLMLESSDITEDAIRRHLLARVNAFRERTGMSLSRISDEAVNDSKFLANVQRGDNFTIRTYQRVIDWLDANEDRPGAAA